MDPSIDKQTGLVFESVMFRPGRIELSFTEDYDRGDGVWRVQTLVVENNKVPEEQEALLEALREFVDAGRVALRDPPERLQA